jgi:uncharacterized integral membrane protein (TIGR02327 family)
MDQYFAFQSVTGLISHIFFIAISFYALQAIMPESWIRKNKVFQAQLLYILLSIAIGSAVSNFFLDISYWSRQLPGLIG